MLISLYLVYEHFAPAASKFCQFGASFDCGVVSKSPYANLDGISYLLTMDYGLSLPLIDISSRNMVLDFLTTNAFLGFLMLLFLLLSINASVRGKSCIGVSPLRLPALITALFTFSIIYGAYLIYIQHSILKTYCILCLALDAIMLAAAVLWWGIKQ
jgi:uncharacterized membrane protein